MEYLFVPFSYLFGNISLAYVVTKIKLGKDIRSFGSGNAGTTNVLRVLGKKYAVAVLVGDVLKGVIPVVITSLFTDNLWIVTLSGFAAILGHNWPVIMGFRGGKGIATSIGVFLAYDPVVASICIGIGVALIALTRYVSLGSIVGMILLPIVSALFHGFGIEFVFGLVVGGISVYRHKANIKRLMAGEESKLGEKVKV